MSAFVEQFLQAASTGILVGCIYGLMCVGLAFIFGIMRVINFAQGDFMMVGMYLAIFIVTNLFTAAVFGPAAPFVAAVATMPVMFFAGHALHRLLIARTTGMRKASEGESHQAQLVLTLGVALILQNGALILMGSAPVSTITPLSSAAWQIPLLYDDFAAVFLNKARTIGAAIALVIAFTFFWMMRSTRLGKTLRGAADNPEAAYYNGIDVIRAHRLAFSIGTAVAGVAGGLIVLYYPVQPFVGIDFIIVMYAGVVLGGMGSISGAFSGGMAIALVQQLATLVLPLQLQNAAIFMVFLLLLFFRPEGFFGRRVERA